MNVHVVIVLEWLVILVGLTLFQAFHGWPGKYADPVMAWHLGVMTAAQQLEIAALFMAGVSLMPSVLAYGASAAIVYWRLWLLLRTRRKI